MVGLSRTAYRYQSKKRSDEALRARLKSLAVQYPRYGYLLLHNLLKGEGLVIKGKRYRSDNGDVVEYLYFLSIKEGR